ncbi:unnamed protein product [Protopolystoma xenopodis]|uniref:SAM-dependent MTase RsmB/NOP-type domain-containing protein n=1 Tax=Protopolystoma xenopodis TaxID=117903 RepID=A0A448X6N9_9PLAT|nr:unnamed protein product [Protopolystoma xenopodis]
MADVPCSGDGTMRKNPDLWLRWTPNLAIGEHFLQARILRRGLELLKDPDSENALPEESPGYSRLIYSTCSLNPIEDEAVVASVLVQCQGAVQLVEHPLFTTDETDGQASDTRSSSGVNEKRFKARKGLTTWRVMTKDGTWYESFDAVPTKYE